MDDEARDRAPTLFTERLVLHPLTEGDADALRRISNEPPVRRYLWDDRPVSEETLRGLISQSEAMFSTDGIGLFGVRLQGDDTLLGFCGFVRLDGMSEPELGYELTPEVWGRGIATEAARRCARYALEEAGFHRIIAGADAPNAASLRVLQKLGMEPIGFPNATAPGEPYYALHRGDFASEDLSK